MITVSIRPKSHFTLFNFWGSAIVIQAAAGAQENTRVTNSVRLPTIQSETWLCHTKVRESHLNPRCSYELSWLFPYNKGERQSVHTNPIWFADSCMNQPCSESNIRDRKAEVLSSAMAAPKVRIMLPCFKCLRPSISDFICFSGLL